jgi:molecular chaperone Hsp33
VVPLHGDHGEPLQRVQQVLEHYMLQSEQLDTKLVLAANHELAAGLLIQRLPVQGEANLEGEALRQRGNEDEIGLSEAFNRIATLAATLTREELLSLPAQQVLRRLFWEETLRVFEPQSPRFACRCNRERVRNMLQSLGREEVAGIVAERGTIEVDCEFCGQQYRFDAVDAATLFTPERDRAPGSGTVQ